MTHQDLDISVVICAYTEDRWDDLVAAVESVQRQSIPPREIIVVVDHNPALLERVRTNLSGVISVANREGRGLGGARNSGIAVAQGDVVAFLDDDAVAAPDWLEYLRSGYDEPDVVGVGGAIEPLWLGGRPAWFPDEFDWVVGCTYRGMPHAIARVRNLIGANMSYHRQVFEALGGFRLGYGCDETEFCIRLRQRWPKEVLLYQPQARVYHKISASRAQWRYFCSRCYFEGRSKAVVTWLVGKQDGLASERVHVFRTLPQGVIRNLAGTFLRGDRAGLVRAITIIAGLTITAAGYLSGQASVVNAARERGWSEQSPQQTI